MGSRSEEVIAAAEESFLFLDEACGGIIIPEPIAELIEEYKIAVAQNLRLEESIHALCKRIDELPSA
jgi:hypothetical protein